MERSELLVNNTVADLAAARENYQEMRDDAFETSVACAAVGSACIGLSGLCAAIGQAAAQVDSAVERGVSLHLETETAVRGVAQTISEICSTGAIAFSGSGIGILLVGAGFGVSSWRENRSCDKELAAEAHRAKWQAAQQQIIDNVFTQN